jgi:hypothetical protein
LHRAQWRFEVRIAENGKNSAIAKRRNVTDNIEIAIRITKKGNIGHVRHAFKN